MIQVDRLMEQRGITLLLMMENAGHNLARLSFLMGKEKSSYTVIAGSGGNAGGGMVAARRLAAWGREVQIFLPKGQDKLNNVLEKQLTRAKMAGVDIYDGLPAKDTENSLILDCYLGYSFEFREDELTEQVFSFFRKNNSIISLDCPSGIDITTGENFSHFQPLATLTIAFVKTGLLHLQPEYLGDFYVIDIGVPVDIYRSEIGIEWQPHFDPNDLEKLSKAFVQDPIQNVRIWRESETSKVGWGTI
ncbi:NAD(P)H-hydrate epimerase [Candidatus Heimdallarchaeota archaeon B3_Heim]|nr:MAG: NAD(P)H-hydrate epimerase [Candidatus Heimdallarchaeota archaeon B3_Heim]